MSFNNINAGSLDKNQFNVIIEIPCHGQPVKYEVDKETGALFVDRFLNTAMYYPCNYGYIPKTLSEDGDPVDVLVITPVPLICGSVIRVRPIGMLRMSDEAGKDAKILAVPIDKLCQRYQSYQDYNDVDLDLRLTIEHFFEHYKDLEKGKWVKIDGWANAKAAIAEISESINRYLRTSNSQIQETLAHTAEIKPKTKTMKAKALAPNTRTTAKAKHASPASSSSKKKMTAATNKTRASAKTTRQRVK